MVARWTARSIMLLLTAAASFGFIVTISQGDRTEILQNGGFFAACWVACLTTWRREDLGGVMIMAFVSFALARTHAISRNHPFDGYETTLMSLTLAVLMIPGALFMLSFRLRSSPSFANMENGTDPGMWLDWRRTATICSVIAMLYTLRLMFLIGGHLDAYGAYTGIVLCGCLAIGLAGCLVSWRFPRSGGMLLLLAAAGFSTGLSVSGLQSWHGEPERTLGYIAVTVPLVAAACCQLAAMNQRLN